MSVLQIEKKLLLTVYSFNTTEKLIEDKTAIQALLELAKTGEQNVVYGVVTTFVNLVNAYEKQEILPEMIELAKFAKHHIPQVNLIFKNVFIFFS